MVGKVNKWCAKEDNYVMHKMDYANNDNYDDNFSNYNNIKNYNNHNDYGHNTLHPMIFNHTRVIGTW